MSLKRFIGIGPPRLGDASRERRMRSLRRECLDHFVPVGLGHLDHLVSEYLMHYDSERPHQSKGNLPLVGHDPPGPPDPAAEVMCKTRLAGVPKHYERKAA